MLSRKFWAWVSVGAISAVAIPVVAGPHLAKLVQRRPAAAARVAVATKTKKPASPTTRTVANARASTTKPVVASTAPIAKRGKSTVAAAPGKAPATRRGSSRTNPAPVANSATTPRVPSAAATARKLFH
ncbi:MAG: hypothetical protein ACAI43_15785 [Phycisphaerae bacterium]